METVSQGAARCQNFMNQQLKIAQVLLQQIHKTCEFHGTSNIVTELGDDGAAFTNFYTAAKNLVETYKDDANVQNLP